MRISHGRACEHTLEEMGTLSSELSGEVPPSVSVGLIPASKSLDRRESRGKTSWLLTCDVLGYQKSRLSSL